MKLQNVTTTVQIQDCRYIHMPVLHILPSENCGKVVHPTDDIAKVTESQQGHNETKK